MSQVALAPLPPEGALMSQVALALAPLPPEWRAAAIAPDSKALSAAEHLQADVLTLTPRAP